MHDDDPQFTNTLPSGGVRAVGTRSPSSSASASRGGPASQSGSASTTENEPPFAPLEPGDFIGRFRIKERIGEGGMGVVYAAEDPELGRVVAIKLLRPVQGDEAESQQKRMLREAQALARVSHRNLVMVFDVGSLRGRVWIAMEYVAGDTLETWLDADRRTWSEIVAVFIEAGRGLAAVHAAGLVHRDFKPGNVIVRADGTVQVLDFGLAARAGDAEEQRPSDPDRAAPDLDALAATLTTTGAFMGTPAYMAPEQFMMLPTDGRADQFSMCVALYEAIYGHRPFGGRDLAQLMAATIQGLQGMPGEMPGVPLGVRQVIGKGLAKNPDDRFSDMNALVAALEQTRAGTRPKGEGAWQRFGLGMIAGGAVLAVGVGVWLSRDDDDDAPAPAAVVEPAPAKIDVAPAPAPTPSVVPPSIAELPSIADPEIVEPEVLPTDVVPSEPASGVATTPSVRPSGSGVPGLPHTGTTTPTTPTTPSALPSLSDLDETEPAADDGAKKPEPTEPDKPADPPKDPPPEPAKEPSADEGEPAE